MISDFVSKIEASASLIFNNQPLKYQSDKACELFLYNDCSKQKFDLFCCEICDKFGCKLININVIENNDFKFYLKDNFLICVGFYRCNNSVRIVVDGDTKLPCFEPSAAIRKEKTTFWQFEVDHSLIDCGMCYFLRLPSGSFFVIDSAHTYSVNDCERIHDFLRERTPENEKTHIAGWFITHGHDDHVAQFTNYLNFYMEDTVIDKVYMNLIPLDHRDLDGWMFANKMYDKNTRDAIAARPEIDLVRLHTGMTFYIEDVKFDVLCSHEDVFPGDNSNYNDSSVVLMITAEGTKILIPGDAGHEESYVLEARYPNYLKADIVQQAHHCHFGTTERFYELVGAECVLFPATQIKFDETYNVHPTNRKSIEIAKGNYYIASNGTVEIDLPYVKGNEKVYPDETFESFKGVCDLWNYQYTAEYKQKLYSEYLSRGGKPLEEYKDGF